MVEQRRPPDAPHAAPDGRAAARAWVALGRRFAPLFEAFVRWVVEQVRQDGLDRVYYFTREGEFFASIHRKLFPPSAAVPRPIVLEVSRLATFAASLPAISPAKLAGLWARYPRQTLRSVLTSLGLHVHDLPNPPERWSLSEDEPLEPADPRWLALLGDERNARWLEQHRTAQRAALNAYLARQGWSDADARTAVVDIGWHGTIQDHLARLRPACDIRGYYFGLMPCRTPERSGPAGPAAASAATPAPFRASFVKDFLAEGDQHLAGQFLKFVGPMEMLCNAPGGSVVGYTIGNSGAQAVRKTSEGEERIFEQCTRHFQAGVLEAVGSDTPAGVPGALAGTRETPARIPDDASTCLAGRDRWPKREHCWRLLRELMIDPPRLIAVAHDRLLHDESFGLGRQVAMRQWIPARLYWESLFSAAARQRLWQQLTTVPWPHGYLVARRLRWVCRLLNLRYFRDLSDPHRASRRRAA